MKNKLTYYLNKESEILSDILVQTNEIKKSIKKGDIEYANRLFTGRSKNLSKVNKYQDAVVKILERSTDDLTVKHTKIDSLKKKVINILSEIKSLDDEISEMLSKGYVEFKEGYKKTKELNLLKKSYSDKKRSLLPKLFDKKT
jgi:ABC-type transporter Mla subunit MlaD